MKYTIQATTQFKKDYKYAVKRGCDISKLQAVITMLANGEDLPSKYIDHALKGKRYCNYRECHIEPDWLLVYKLSQSILVLSLYRTGTHSDIF